MQVCIVLKVSFWKKLENHNIGIFFMCKMFNLGAKLYKTEILQSTFWKGCMNLKELVIPCYDQTSIFRLTLSPQSFLNGVDSTWFTRKRRDFIKKIKKKSFIMPCLNKVQVNDMEKQYWGFFSLVQGCLDCQSIGCQITLLYLHVQVQ